MILLHKVSTRHYRANWYGSLCCLSTTQSYPATVTDIDITFSIQILTTTLFVVTIGQI